jgi:ABC transporter substrate binding protein (PQQ-dependent alcohol dehydrogenase system)
VKPRWPRVAACGLLVLAASVAHAATTWRALMLVPAADERLSRARLERGALGHPDGPAADALKVAVQEGQSELPEGHKLALEVVEVADAAAAAAAATRGERAGALALVADLPAPWMLAAADAAPKTPLLNVGHSADVLRESQCRANTWHVAPSDRMRADALAQTLLARRWTQVLVLEGPLEADRARAATVQASLRRHGLKVVATRPFKLSADPRERDLANPLLLTGPGVASAYDAVWVVDSDGEFAASLPYRTALPRPVVGDGGLAAVAWSPKFDRYGAPQVTRRLTKAAGRPMGAHDWPAYVAGRALVGAIVAASKGPLTAAHKALAEGEVDASKGVSMSFRAWDGQLRQPLLLSDGQSVIALAPADGVLHPKNVLDTLGADAPEKLCKARVK